MTYTCGLNRRTGTVFIIRPKPCAPRRYGDLGCAAYYAAVAAEPAGIGDQLAREVGTELRRPAGRIDAQ